MLQKCNIWCNIRILWDYKIHDLDNVILTFFNIPITVRNSLIVYFYLILLLTDQIRKWSSLTCNEIKSLELSNTSVVSFKIFQVFITRKYEIDLLFNLFFRLNFFYFIERMHYDLIREKIDTGSSISFGPVIKASFPKVCYCKQQNNICWIVAWA